MRIQMPASLRLEHDELNQLLAAWKHEPGRLGDEIRRVARLLEPHARKEEAFAMPALGLIARLARGEVHPDMAQVFPHTDWRRLDCIDFGERLMNHLRTEEEVLYPAAILVGEYLRLALASRERELLEL